MLNELDAGLDALKLRKMREIVEAELKSDGLNLSRHRALGVIDHLAGRRGLRAALGIEIAAGQ